ncbi:MAG: glycosyltransferase family 2 protein [Deltaproteobacteria bacterium]|nr:glycosyltransferase family 2 protein [Deltaproteobacteria bacterium]
MTRQALEQKDFQFKKKTPLVSVVIPVYNHEAYVAAAIDSVLTQDYPAVELMVINDGSTDSTDKVVMEKLKASGGAFTYVSKQNEGVAKTLSVGLDAADGKYFIELCSDDIMTEGSIRKRVEYMEAHQEYDCVFANARIMDASGAPGEVIIKDGVGKPSHVTALHTFEQFVKSRTLMIMHTGIFKTERLRALGGIDTNFYSEDVYTRYLFARRANVGYLNEPVLYYRMHDTNISRGKPFWMRREKVMAFEKLLRDEDSEEMRPVIEEQLFLEYIKYLKAGLRHRIKKEDMISVAQRSLAMRPFSVKALYYRVRAIFMR